MANVRKIRWQEWLPIHGWRIVAVVEAADDVPRRLPRRGAVLIGSVSRPKWVAFDCPCGRGHRILLNTDKSRRPHWSVSLDGPLSITPSIDSVYAMHRCHYFVRDGKVRWVAHDDSVERSGS